MNQIQMDGFLKSRLDQEVDLMKQAIDSYTRNKPNNYEQLIRDCEVRIFNALVNLGDFDQAFDYAKTFEDKRLLTRLMMSFLREESETCKCPVESVLTQGAAVEIPRFFMWRRIYHQKFGYWVDVYKCSRCNFMTIHSNATCTFSARKLERTRNKPENTDKRNRKRDEEALR